MGQDISCRRKDKTLIDPLLLLLLLLVAALIFVVLVLSPFIIELKKPRDKGPRRILRMPFERRIRGNRRKPIMVGFDPPDNSSIENNLEDILKRAGAKTAKIGVDTTRIFGDVIFSPRFETEGNIIVEGDVIVGDSSVFHRSIKAKGNLHIGNNVVVKGNVVSEGDLFILDDAVIGGSVHSEGSVRIGENVSVAVSIVAVGDVEIHENSEVKKNILTRGVIKMLRHSRVDLPSSLDEID